MSYGFLPYDIPYVYRMNVTNGMYYGNMKDYDQRPSYWRQHTPGKHVSFLISFEVMLFLASNRTTPVPSKITCVIHHN